MTSFTGLYVQRLSTGVICDVQVIDAAGNENSLAVDVYQKNGIQPPIEQLPDMEVYNKSFVKSQRVSQERTIKSIIGWVTLVAVIAALMATIVSIQFDCYGLPKESDKCGWSQALFPVTAGLFFVVAWPVSFVVGFVLWWWKDINA